MSKKEAPIQGVFAKDVKGEVDVFPEYAAGLKDIEGFSHLILKVRGNKLEIREVDILDGTPLIDIKPFVPRFDNRDNAKSGWLSNPHLDMVRGESGKHRSD